MRTSRREHETWLTDWARPKVWADGPSPVRFTVSDDGRLLRPPAKGGVGRVRVAGVDRDTGETVQAAEGSIAEDQFTWEPYNIADEHARLEAAHDVARGAPDGTQSDTRRPRYSEERAGLFTEFSRLPTLGAGVPPDKVASEYGAWCDRYGSPGLFAFLFANAGQRRGQWYVQEKRTGALSTEREFFRRYPEADVGDERYREPVRVEWLSREVELLRHTLTLSMAAQGREGVDAGEREAARAALSEHLPFAVQGMSAALPDYRQGVYLEGDDAVLWRWLWTHAGSARRAFTRDPRSGKPARVWTFDSFMGALYHLILDDLTAGQVIRRCADPKCRVFFRPKREGEYHDLKCRTRVRLEATRQGARRALELHDAGCPTDAIAEQLGWTPAKTARELRNAIAAREARQKRTQTANQPKGDPT